MGDVLEWRSSQNWVWAWHHVWKTGHPSGRQGECSTFSSWMVLTLASVFQEVMRNEWMFKLVGKEYFNVGKAKCCITIEAVSGFAYEYTLEVNGKSLKKFSENQSKIMKTWILTIAGKPTRVVLGGCLLTFKGASISRSLAYCKFSCSHLVLCSPSKNTGHTFLLSKYRLNGSPNGSICYKLHLCF